MTNGMIVILKENDDPLDDKPATRAVASSLDYLGGIRRICCRPYGEGRDHPCFLLHLKPPTPLQLRTV